MKLYFTLFSLCIVYSLSSQTVVVINDDDLTADTIWWTNDKEYHLDGYVFVEAGGVLNIEEGTVIKGLASPSTGDKTSVLIITRGAKINAIGTQCEPIIFTAEFDDVNDPNDLTSGDRGLWGGLVMLGHGIVGVNGGEFNVEGIPSTEGRATYGGTDNADNSGTLKYVSIRHGGDKLEANNEINGLTLAGVGRGTTIDYVEVFANLDDGIEFFGGAVSVRHAAVSFCGDDSFDYDQSWDGFGQFWFSLQDDAGNRAGEWDGSESADLNPKVVPVISNATFIGGGATTVNPDNNDALKIRNDAAVNLHNSIITGFARRAIVIDDNSWNRFQNGEIVFNNNLIYDCAAGNTLDDLVSAMDKNTLITHLESGNTKVEDPGLAGVSRMPNNALDPRVKVSGAAYGNAVALNDPWFEASRDIGAFGDDNWASCWTALDAYGYFGSLVATDDPVLSETDWTMKIFPNPTSHTLNISFELSTDMDLKFRVLDLSGKTVFSTGDNLFTAGKSQYPIQLSGMNSGTYIATIESAGAIVGRRIFIKD